jgi:hypothetical protein
MRRLRSRILVIAFEILREIKIGSIIVAVPFYLLMVTYALVQLFPHMSEDLFGVMSVQR